MPEIIMQYPPYAFKDLLTLQEAIEFVGKSESHFKRLRKDYLIPCTRAGYYEKKDLEKAMRGYEIPANTKKTA